MIADEVKCPRCGREFAEKVMFYPVSRQNVVMGWCSHCKHAYSITDMGEVSIGLDWEE